MSVVKILLVIACIIIYASLSHAALAAHDGQNIWRQIAMLMLTVPTIGIACWGAVTFLKRLGVAAGWRIACGTITVLILAYALIAFWQVLLSRLDWIYLIEYVATNAMLCWFFAHTLFGERTPLITALARTIHLEMPDNIVRYTHKVTLAWALFFAVQILTSMVIFFAAPIKIWSLFANVLNWPLVMLMFAAEYACRKRVNPDFQHATIKQSVSAYFNNRRKI